MNFMSTRLGALVTGGLFLLVVPAGAKDAFNGIITYGNGIGALNCSCTGGDPGYLASPLNDLGVPALAGLSPLYPSHDFQPDPGTIASGTNDFVATGGDGIITPAGPLGDAAMADVDEPLIRDIVANWLERRGGRIRPEQFLSANQRRFVYPGERPVRC